MTNAATRHTQRVYGELYHTHTHRQTHTKIFCVCLTRNTHTHTRLGIWARLRHGRVPRGGHGRICMRQCSVPAAQLSRFASHSRVGAPCCAAAAGQVTESIMRLHVWVRSMMVISLYPVSWHMADLGYDCVSCPEPVRVTAVVSCHPRSKAGPPGVRLASFRGLASWLSTCGVSGRVIILGAGRSLGSNTNVKRG